MSKEIIFRNTANHKGRKIIITPENSMLTIMSVGRIIIYKDTEPIKIQTKEKEYSFICLHGSGKIISENKIAEVKPYDAVYAPKNSTVKILTDNNLDLVECSAPVSEKYSFEHVKFDEVKNDTNLHMSLGKNADRRELYTLIGDNVKGGRLYNGVTFSEKGNWTSWPPHEHTELREEVYLYFDMPKPAFGIQMVYSGNGIPENVIPVYENDAVVIFGGYHPNVAIPGHSINFVWMLCARRENVDRAWGGVNVQPEFLSK